jgi:hypothetical protein
MTVHSLVDGKVGIGSGFRAAYRIKRRGSSVGLLDMKSRSSRGCRFANMSSTRNTIPPPTSQ